MKAWKCARRLSGVFDGVEEHVHQHRLAAPDRAIDVEAARRLGGLEPHEPGEGARLRLGAIVLELRAQRVELAGKLRLRRIELEAAVVNERAVALGDAGHGSVLARELEGRVGLRSY